MNGAAAALATLFVTVVLHATVASCVSLAIGRFVVREPRQRELLWKATLVLPFVTALWAVLVIRGTGQSSSIADTVSTVLRAWSPVRLPGKTVAITVSGFGANRQVVQHISDGIVPLISGLLALTVILPGAVATARLMLARRRFVHSLQSRHPIASDNLGLSADLMRLGNGRIVRISLSSKIDGAVALGSSEVCFSGASIAQLHAAERSAVVAHELAHLERHDAPWLLWADVVTALLAVQPLVRLVARRLRNDAEFICDDVAVRRTGDRVTYLRALTILAAPHDAATPTLAFADSSSPLIERAKRVLAAQRPTTNRAAVLPIAMVGALVVTLLRVPAVRLASGASRVVSQVTSTTSASRPSTSIQISVSTR